MSVLFPGFKRRRIRTSGATINLETGGDGPPVLLLHGYPETHAMWHKVAPQLARDYTVVCPDFGKRVRTLTVLDISPTLKMYQSTSLAFARAYWHWFFLIQAAPLPESLLAGHVPGYVLKRLGRGKGGLKHFDKRAMAAYVRAFRDPRTIHGTCEDYRAAATIDLVHDKQDLRRKLRMPVLALWGKHGVIEALFDCLADWREVAADVRGRALDCGHFIPEEKPRELLAELRRFLGAPR
jgi:haloacetate dehalogenase